MSITKKKIAKDISSKIDITERESLDILEAFISNIKTMSQKKLMISNFGVFHVKTTKKRIGTSLFMLLPPIGLFAALKFYKKGYVDIFAALYMSVIFTIAASISAEYSIHINHNILKKIFALFTVSLGVYYYFKKD